MSRWIDDWNPEDETFWQTRGRTIARRNLVWSIAAENLGFSVWLVWSVIAASLPAAGFRYATDQLFFLVALPGLVGALVRIPYTFAVPRFGGRNWTIASAVVLLVPTVSLAVLVSRPSTPFWLMACAAATAGLGGGNFASSMANISFFFPDREKGFALGLNAAGGNIGVANVQLVVPLLVGAGGAALSRAGWIWLPFIAIAAAGAALRMDNLTSAKSSFREQLSVAKTRHTWIISALYIGTFGSFVGYSAAFPLLIKTQFPAVTASLAFLGPLVGSVARPLGGKLADRFGGARVTLASFVAMTIATVSVLAAVRMGTFGGFLASFLSLFVTSGIGNGSTFRIVPSIFRSRRDAAAVLGLASAIGALGGYGIPRAIGASIAATHGPSAALGAFLAFYAICIFTTWWCYGRAPVAGAGALASAQGKVWLVGAGPGRADLLTVRALRVLASADVVAYDELVSPEVLALAPRTAHRVPVGRRAKGLRHHEARIHPMVIERAREGKVVVRLKCGDPFVFGRGGEEAEELSNAGVPFEVVPGISAALGAAASTGIALTHRDASAQVTFATARLAKDEEAPNYPSEGTLVLYMALGTLPETMHALVRSGRSPETPAAIVSHATMPDERTVVGTVGDLASRAVGLEAPAIVIVGDVVARSRLPVLAERARERGVGAAGVHEAIGG